MSRHVSRDARGTCLRALSLFLAGGLFLSLTACSGDKEKASKAEKVSDKGKEKINKGDQKWATDAARDKANNAGSNTDNFQHRADNPFFTAARTPLSTFSIDVDTASYSIVRRFLTDGKLPPKDAVRVEELVNYFSYDYPQPKDGRPVSMTTDLARCPWNEKHLLARVGLRGLSLDPRQLPQRNFVFLVDTSGSMNQPDRLPLLQKSLRLLVQEMSPRDRVALVAYAGSAGLVLDSTPGTQKQKILSAIDRLHAGGSTNGGAGIQLAYQVAEEHFIKNGLNRVILGTDGDFNVGVRGDGDLVRLIEQKRKTGVYLTILGYGMGNLKDSKLEQLAHHGNGHYAYIDTLDEAKKLFVEQGAALVTIARDVKLQVEFNPHRVGAYRLIGYENRLLRDQDFKDDTKDAGDMGSGHTVTALYEIVPAGTTINIPGIDPLKYQTGAAPTAAAKTSEWLTVKMRYKHPEKETSEEVSEVLRAEPVAMANAPEDFRFAAGIAAFALTLRESPYKGAADLDVAAGLASNALGLDPQGRRAEFLTLVRKAQGLKPASQ